MVGVDVVDVDGPLAKVPCDLTLTIYERQRQKPSASATLVAADLAGAGTAIRNLLKSVEGQVVSHIENRRPGGTSTASYQLRCPRDKFEAMLAGLIPIGRLENLLQILPGRAVLRDVVHGQLGVSDNREKDVVKVVGNTSGQGADSLQFHNLLQLSFRLRKSSRSRSRATRITPATRPRSAPVPRKPPIRRADSPTPPNPLEKFTSIRTVRRPAPTEGFRALHGEAGPFGLH